MRLLVAGGDRVDAGKTTFATGLLARRRERTDGAVAAFKPRAGNDFWFDHDDVAAVLGDDRLYGKDARRLVDADDTDRPPEACNPVHRLWRPTPGRTGMLGEAGRTFLCDRLRTEAGDEFVVNAVAEREGLLPEAAGEGLPLAEATRVESVESFNEVMADRYLPAFERLADAVREREESVVESYGDIALPVADVAVDAAAVVEPGRARVYAGDRYLRACEVARGSAREGRREERVDRVTGMIEPVATVDLPPLTSAERDDPAAVAAAYAPAYEALVEAAGVAADA